MSLKVLNTENAPAAVGPYSQGMQAGNFIYVSGQLPLDAATKEMVKDSIESATRKSLENCKAIVESAGATLNDVVKVEIFLKDMNEFAAMNGVYSEFFTDHKPARACVEVARLPLDAKIEIQMIAYK
ncbi:MAG: RidA family protein [Acidaminobacteraceae bacterium]